MEAKLLHWYLDVTPPGSQVFVQVKDGQLLNVEEVVTINGHYVIVCEKQEAKLKKE